MDKQSVVTSGAENGQWRVVVHVFGYELRQVMRVPPGELTLCNSCLVSVYLSQQTTVQLTGRSRHRRHLGIETTE